MINVAVLGYGTVGSGVVEVITRNQEIISKKAGQDIKVKYVLDLRDFPGDPVQEILVHDYNVIVQDPEVDIVVEVMGGVNPAYTFVKSALEAGKSVATSNKELVAVHGAELLQVAKEKNVNFLFEASVGGGIPIIRTLTRALTADEIFEITGILNGTTNYILSKMTDEGSDFDSVLKRAQEKGYAERNPEADVEGYDACRKIAILTSLVCGKQVSYEDIYTEGITKITDVDFKYVKAMGAAVKLFGTTTIEDGKIYSMVSPFVIGEDHVLKNVNGVFNGVSIKSNMLGETMFYGKGAGKLPTASAVVSDVVDAARHMGKNIMTIWETEKVELADIKDFACRFFVRVKASNTKSDIEAAFGNVTYIEADGITGETAFLTDRIKERDFQDKIQSLDMINRIRTTLA